MHDQQDGSALVVSPAVLALLPDGHSRLAATPRRVLIVEDDFFTATAMAELVEGLNHTVVGPFYNLKAGLEHALADGIDLALLDFDLGQGTNSVPIARALAERGIAFAFASGTDPQIILRAFPGVPILRKPFGEHDLWSVLLWMVPRDRFFSRVVKNPDR